MLSFFSQQPSNRKPSKKSTKSALRLEQLEGRAMMATFAVTNLNDTGAGSLRQAITSANSAAGADTITFSVAGSIQLRSALPVISGEVDINGDTAPGFAADPLVEIDFKNFNGLQLSAGASGSTIRSLALGNAKLHGITLTNTTNVLIVGNYIGLDLDGVTVAPSKGNGIEVAGGSGNTIGGETALDRNVISGNRTSGINLTATQNNSVLGNYIGTDKTGLLDRGNTVNGVQVTGATATGNIIGGGTANVISGNNANGVLLVGKSKLTTVSGNRIGTTATGTAALGNGKDGVRIDNSTENLIGYADPVSGVDYFDADDVTDPVSAWQGIRAGDDPGEYLLVGTSGDDGLLYEGSIDGATGTSYTFAYPSSFTTSAYGPENLAGDDLRIVGSYKNADFATAPVEVNGFLFEGEVGDLGTAGNYTQINYPGAKYNYVHSTMGGLVVGNYDSPAAHGTHSLPLGPGHAYIYDIDSSTFIEDIVYPGSLSNTAYGIWHNGETHYTIVGGYSLTPGENFADQNIPIGNAYMVDYDSLTGEFTNWKSFSSPFGANFISHFEGISSVEKGVYTLNADSVQAGTGDPTQGSFVTVRRNDDGTFEDATWVELNYPGIDPADNVTSSNSVYGNQVVGLVVGDDGPISYQATVNSEFQLSNVISGNSDNGIGLYNAHDNEIAMNFIGTDVTGAIDLGNADNGILVTSASKRNLIGGEATGGNDPTNDIFARPPMGNLISGNNLNGVFITGKSTLNQLSGNFIGTTATGNAALGNTLDGVAIVDANSNSLIGCNLRQDPFVFYNVLSGNGGNGLRVTNSNDTTIQANFFGIGADNDTDVGNALNGVLVEGSSTRTTMGGPIPLGNVVAANTQNGIVVRGRASYFISYNSFVGLAAFSTNQNLGNGQDGILVTSTGGNNLLRTNVIASNGDDGVELSGAATGVRVTGNIIGMNTDGMSAMGNVGNGVEVGGTAHHNVIGGPQPTANIIPQNIISANGGNGVAVVGKAHHIEISNGYIGTNVSGTQAFGNALAGVYLGTGTTSNTVGSTDSDLPTMISGNLGNGIEMQGARNNTVIGTLIGTDPTGLIAIPNLGSGVLLNSSHDNVIGRRPSSSDSSTANIIANNDDNGVLIQSGVRNTIFGNSIHSNDLLGIDLATGANNNQAAPVLTSATRMPLGMQVKGVLTSKPRSTFVLEFFANSASSPSGRISIGKMTVKTTAAGTVSFTFLGQLPPVGVDDISATATDSLGNTSEFGVLP